MAQYLITNKGNPAKVYRKHTLSQQVHIGAFSLIVMIIALIGVMSVLFLTRFNVISTKGYLLKKLESERMEIVKEIERSEMDIAQVRTLENILASKKVQTMVQVNENRIVYLRDTSGIAKSE